MPKFRKKQIVVDAHQWFTNGDHPDDDIMRPFEDSGLVPEVPREGAIVKYYRIVDLLGDDPCAHCGKVMCVHGWIDTLEGGHIVCPGDWIISGVEGERYPCKHSIFLRTYEPVYEPVIE
jgi:hypothetical protein